ncbi:MAG: hypothetical protein ACRCTJ_03520 [Brevinema sp.]
MGKVYKNFAPLTKQNIGNIYHSSSHFELPSATIIPLEEFDSILERAEQFLVNDNFMPALQDLINLEVTKFENIKVHELLADLFLKINQLDYAKEQCQICAHLISAQYDTPSSSEPYNLRLFSDLVRDAGDIDEVGTQYKTLMMSTITNENFHHGTKITFNFATLLMAQNKYKEAEKILVTYKEAYLSFLKKEN